jgi:hypothetical protein
LVDITSSEPDRDKYSVDDGNKSNWLAENLHDLIIELKPRPLRKRIEAIDDKSSEQLTKEKKKEKNQKCADNAPYIDSEQALFPYINNQEPELLKLFHESFPVYFRHQDRPLSINGATASNFVQRGCALCMTMRRIKILKVRNYNTHSWRMQRARRSALRSETPIMKFC